MARIPRNEIAGSKWWKFDFHTHTPASNDFRTPDPPPADLERAWLMAFMAKEIDCVAITDHNTGGEVGRRCTIDGLKATLSQLDTEKPVGYRPLYLFPGVEISVNGNIHCLAILDPSKTTADVATLLGACEFRGTLGECDDCTDKSLTNVVEEIVRAGGVAIPAHADGPKGLFKVHPSGNTLIKALNDKNIAAFERTNIAAALPTALATVGCTWSEVVGSDCHTFADAGRAFTWVKMGEPSLEGLMLALIDGSSSLRRGAQGVDPNSHASSYFKSLTVAGAKVCGNGAPLHINFNPWMNCLIGGRGSGKSTIVECLRLCSGRAGELPESLSAQFEDFSSVCAGRGEPGAMTPRTEIEALFCKDGATFRLTWKGSTKNATLEELAADQSWRTATGNATDRCPMGLYSQKQIYEMAHRQFELLRIVDEAPQVGFRDWKSQWDVSVAKYLTKCAAAREAEAAAADETRLAGEVQDVDRKLAILAAAGDQALFAEHTKLSERSTTLELGFGAATDIAGDLTEVVEKLATAIGKLPPALATPTAGYDVSTEFDALRSRMSAVRAAIEEGAGAITNEVAASRARINDGQFGARMREVQSQIEARVQAMRVAGIEDIKDYEPLVARRQQITRRLEEIEALKLKAHAARNDAATEFVRQSELRREITAKRREFINAVIGAGDLIRMRIVPCGRREGTEEALRTILRKENSFENDLGDDTGSAGLLGSLYSLYPEREGFDTFEQKLAGVKLKLERGILGATDIEWNDARFASHLKNLPPEAVDRLHTWWPEDSVVVEFKRGANYVPISEGSAGQKTAAILSFLLAHGSEPIVLDQPEDDLDNGLIYDLIVKQMRDSKPRRQIIVITHNANIVVNGDSELVGIMHHHQGQCVVSEQDGMHSRKIRTKICEIMEGGEDAFRSRFKRIHARA